MAANYPINGDHRDGGYTHHSPCQCNRRQLAAAVIELVLAAVVVPF